MPTVLLKTSHHEPNFSFASIAAQTSNSPDSDFHSDQSDVVLRPIESNKNYFDYRDAITEGVSSMGIVGLDPSKRVFSARFVEHCRLRWGFYVTLAFGLISISGCIAAGVALSAVQPYLIAELISSQHHSPKDAPIEPPMDIAISFEPDIYSSDSIPTTTIPPQTDQPELTTRISSTTHESSIPETSTSQESTTSAVKQLPTITTEPSKITEDDYAPSGGESVVFRSFFPTPNFRPKPLPFFHTNEDNREPDRFPDPRVMFDTNPRFHNLNITFDDPRRRIFKRSPNWKPNGRLTLMKPTIKDEQNPSTKWVFQGEEPVVATKTRGICEKGFEWNEGMNRCFDVDECLELGIRACGINSECINTPGTYSCRCNPGFRLDPKTLACADIDECKESNGECSPLALCENQPGGFICRCLDGFYGNGIICEIDTNNYPAERIDPISSQKCQTTFPPRSYQAISNHFFPDNFPIVSKYQFCVQKLQSVCKIAMTFRNFLPSQVNHQEFDYLHIASKIFTGMDLNGQTLFLLESNDAPLAVEFSTDSELKGNRFTLELNQELCPATIVVPACSSLLRIEDNVISSSAPHYFDNTICTSAVYPPKNSCGMQLNFHEFSLEGPRERCPFDYLDIFEDKLCGNMKHELREIIFPKETAKIPIIFSSDASFVARGFNISFVWITDCL